MQPQPAPWEREVRAGGIATYHAAAVPQYTDAQIEAAVESLSEPGRLEEAQRLVASAAPQLQRILNEALDAGGWFGDAHQAEVLKAAGIADPDERMRAVRTLIAEETRREHADRRRRRVRTGALLHGSERRRRLTDGSGHPLPGPRGLRAQVAGDTTVLVDPFLTGNPKATVEAAELEPTHILLTHGHQDHYGDTVEIAKRTGATVVAITELAGEIGEEGVENVFDPNLGGTVKFDWGWVKLVPAWHTSTTPKGTVSTPAGLLINIGGTLVYHLGDTALFSDLQLIARRGDQVDVALVPIGGHYTMDRLDAVTAVEFVGPTRRHPVPLRHVPADRDRRRGVQGRRRVADERAGRHPRARGDALGVTHAIVLIEAERVGDADARRRARRPRGRRRGLLGHRRVGLRGDRARARAGPARAADHRQARRRSTGSSARTRWSPSRPSPSTTSRRCSRSAS